MSLFCAAPGSSRFGRFVSMNPLPFTLVYSPPVLRICAAPESSRFGRFFLINPPMLPGPSISSLLESDGDGMAILHIPVLLYRGSVAGQVFSLAACGACDLASCVKGLRALDRWYAKESTRRGLAQLCCVPSPPQPGAARPEADVDPSDDSNPPAISGEPGLVQTDDRDERDSSGGLPWDPLAPRLLHEVQRWANEGRDRPLTAAVVLAAALPFSGAAFFFGAPVLAGDAALQWGTSTPIARAVGYHCTRMWASRR